MAKDWTTRGFGHVPALQTVKVLNATWTDCPVEIQKIIEGIWQFAELNNDVCVYKTSIDDLKDMKADGFECEQYEDGVGWAVKPLDLDPLIKYLVDHGCTEKEEVWLHFWW